MSTEKALFFALAAPILVALCWLAMPKDNGNNVAFFAYGTNLDPATMRARAGGFEMAGKAALQGYSLAFQTNKESEFGVANVLIGAGEKVSGAVYFLTPAEADALDKSAGVPEFYERRNVEVEFAGNKVKAFTYALSGSAHYAVPSGVYLESVKKGFAAYYGNQSFAEIEGALAVAAKKQAGS